MASSSASPKAEFSHLGDIEDFMVAFAERVDNMLEQRSVLGSATETAVTSAPSDIDYEFLRNSLATFFLERCETGKWTLHGNLPRKGSDKELDDKLVELKLHVKRDYVSRRWLIFKKSKGIHPPPILDLHSDEIRERYTMKLSPMIVQIINKSVTATTKQCSDVKFVRFAALCREAEVKTLLNTELEYFTERLSETLATCSLTNLDSRIARFEFEARYEQRRAFLASVKAAVAPEYSDTTASSVAYICTYSIRGTIRWMVWQLLR